MWNAAFPSFLIAVREGLEGGLIVSVLVAGLVRAGARERLGVVWVGVGAAVAVSVSFAAVLSLTAARLPAGGQDVFGGVLSLVAVGFVTVMVFWMRGAARSWAGGVRARVVAAVGASGVVLALVSFVAVAREGLEASLFLWAAARSAGQGRGPVVGAGLGLVVAVVVCWGLYRRVLRIDLSRFFAVTGVVLIVIAAGVLAYGLGDLQEGGWVGGRAAYAFDLTGVDAGSWYAALVAGTLNVTPAMSWVQVVGYVVFLVSALVVFVRGMRAAGPVGAGATSSPSAPVAVPVLSRAERRAAREVELVERIVARRVAKQARGGRVGGSRRMPRWAVGTSICGVPIIGAVAAITVLGPADSAAASSIALNDKSCGTGWSNPSAGSQTFNLNNTSGSTAEVYLINPSTNAVFAEMENLAPGTVHAMTVDVSAGQYAFRCVFTSGAKLTSSTYTVTGKSSGGLTGFAAVTDDDLKQPVDTYRAYVQQSLPGLLADSQKLDADLAAGSLGAAKVDWLAAHLDYERLGAAYGTFEDFDAKIDGRATGLAGGVEDASWTGFHRIEYGLWHGQAAGVLKPLGDQLVSDVQGLIKAFPSQDTDPNDLPLRTHEILENALQFQLTGIADYGSGTALATTYANVQGTREVLSTLVGLMQTRDPAALKSINTWLDTVSADLKAAQNPDGSWTPLTGLTADARMKLDGDMSELLEQLSAVPTLLEERSAA